ncbi:MULTISPECIES: DUF817 family protein [Streptomyces]|uniref:Integral membrane protein n=1 Tax=Streptomyces canarius TaxID=285453 RepID=A0ABQ3CET5_9ACTN|nr:DUF817 family protein [Streptomyces canarius]GHA02771.1 hypothetical protein GCM10010345_03560 [Streptomyces canarius]
MRKEEKSAASGLRHGFGQLARFGMVQARACACAVALSAGLGASRLLPPLPVARYTWSSSTACCSPYELIKVRLGSWSYPEDALTKVAGVPLYGGLLYAAVAGHVCRARRLMGLRYTRYRAAATTLVAATVYLNFFTHHRIPDLRRPLAAAMTAATAGTWVGFSVGAHRYRMPLTASFVLIGFFLWVAENAAT